MARTVPLAAAVNDLSGFGRCSLTVVLPVLSAMGIQACPLPTALLSNHTAYDSCFFQDLTASIPPYLAEWKKLGLSFDAIFTGFLGSWQQVSLVEEFVHGFRGEKTLFLADPVMGDDGELYATYDHSLCQGMARLAFQADVITPNLTEACLLAEADHNQIAAPGPDRLERLFRLGRQLAGRGPWGVVITGIQADSPGQIGNLVIDRRAAREELVLTPAVPRSFSGTGDVFASVLCGRLIQGWPLLAAVRSAAGFVSQALAGSARENLPALDGVAFEPYLPLLWKETFP